MDPQDFTSADAYAEYVADNMPDLTEVSAAALALIKALRKLESCKLVTKVEPVETLVSWISLDITEAFNFDEDDRFTLYIRDEVNRAVSQEEKSWITAIERETTDAKLAKPSIDMAGMVQAILTGGRA